MRPRYFRQRQQNAQLFPSGTAMSGRLGEPSGFKPRVVRLVGTIVGALVRRNS